MEAALPQPSTPPTDDLGQLRAFTVRLISEGHTEQALDVLLGLIQGLRDTNNRQALRIARLLHQRFGRSSEKIDARQLSLFLASIPEDAPASQDDPTAEGAEQVRLELERLKKLEKEKGNKRKRTGRNALPENLPREVIRLEVSPDVLDCPGCGEPKALIGVESSEVLEFVPAHFKVIVYEREKRACRACGDGVVIAGPADKVVEGGRPGPGLLAHLTVGKYLDGLPLHRLARLYQRYGVRLPASTLGQWVGVVAEALEPLYRLLKQRTLRAYVLGVDDTGIKVLDRTDPNNIKRGHLWAYVGYEQGLPTRAVFDYTPDWKGDHPLAFMEGRRGYVQGDGYRGYDDLFQGPEPPCINVGCMAHARRYYKKALDAKDLRAAVPLDLFQKLYAVEALATKQGASVEHRLAMRQEHSRPLMERLGQWVSATWPHIEPKTPMHAALTYSINQWESLKVFLTDGAVPIDNNAVERHIRPIAVGRRNYLFAGSDEGARRAAILYSMIACCTLARVEPLAWLTDILTHLSGGWLHSRLDQLLPESWTPTGS